MTIMAELLGLPEHHRADYPHWPETLFDAMGSVREDSTPFLQVGHEVLGYVSEMAVKGDYAPGGLADALFRSVGTADISAEEAGSIQSLEVCWGAPLVRLEARMVLEQLAHRVRSLSFAAPPKRKRNSMVRGFKELRVVLQPA